MASPRILVCTESYPDDLISELATQQHVDAIPINSWEDLKTAPSRFPNVAATVVDADLVEQSLEGLCRRLLRDNSRMDVLVLVPRTRARRLLSSEKNLQLSLDFHKKFPNQVHVWPSSDVAKQLVTYFQRLAQNAAYPLTSDQSRVTPADAFGPKPDRAMAPNALAQRLGRTLVQFSASVHLHSKLLRENFVEMLADEESRLGSVEDDVLHRWKKYIAILSTDKARDYATEAGPDRNACVRFGQAVFVPNRFTFLILGDRGCGKTTFVTHFFSNYLPVAYSEISAEVFIVDFLTYDFVRDAQTLAEELQRRVFLACHSWREDLHEYPTFDAFLRNRNYKPHALLRTGVPEDLDVTPARDFLTTVLSGLSESELLSLYQAIVPSPTVSQNPDLWAWRTQLLEELPATGVCAIVAYYAQQARETKEKVITDSIFNAAIQRKHLVPLLREAGINPKTRETPPSISFHGAIQHFLALLSQRATVFLVVDNADRALFASAELEIFRTAWGFLPLALGDKRVRLVFTMRTDTYYRQHSALSPMISGEDIRDIANVYTLTLHPPEFVRLANVRLRNLRQSLTHKEDKELGHLLETYVSSVLNADIAAPMFRALFGGDMRRNLELFEFAIASPHIVQSNAYYYAATKREIEKRAATDYIRKHRLLTSLMLGPWATFRQRRSLVFLNVFNAQLSTRPTQMWRNTLLIPRVLDLIQRSGTVGIDQIAIEELSVGGLGYTQNEVTHALTLLQKYGLIEFVKSDREEKTSKDAKLRLTDCGRFYVQGDNSDSGLMYRLEYIQTVYWDMAIPISAYFGRFKTVMELKDLELFVLSFCDLIRGEEQQELQCLHSRFLRPDYHYLVEKSIAARIQDVAGRQVASIYFSKR